eukprot:1334884-Amphidinium_carterae.1
MSKSRGSADQITDKSRGSAGVSVTRGSGGCLGRGVPKRMALTCWRRAQLPHVLARSGKYTIWVYKHASLAVIKLIAAADVDVPLIIDHSCDIDGSEVESEVIETGRITRIVAFPNFQKLQFFDHPTAGGSECSQRNAVFP